MVNKPDFCRRFRKGSGKANHGLVLSETAKSKESDPGKGEAISTQAKTQRQALQDRDNQNNSEKNHLTNQIPKVHFGYLHHAKVFLI